MTDAWFLLPVIALISGLVALTSLGSQVLNRGVVFIDLAVAQAAAAAVVWSDFLFQLDSAVAAQIAATAGAILASLGVAWVSRKWVQHREALIGLIYVATACAALIGASRHPHGREKLFQLLAADILWVNLFNVLALSVCALIVWIIVRQRWLINDLFFYGTFAVVASVAVPTLGLFLVFASLIAPALWLEKGVRYWLVTCTASLVCMAGLALSWFFDTPSGPSVVLSLATFGIGAMVCKQK